MKKYAVQVRNGDGSLVETIQTQLRAEAIGNFVPLFCRYKGNARCLVESDALHVDDPLRCNPSEHVGKLFIRPRGKDGVVVPTWKDVRLKTRRIA